MKISKNSYSYILKTFKENKEEIEKYVPKLKENGKFSDFNTRLAFDCAHAFLEKDFISNLYETESLNDTHVKTALIKALKELEIIKKGGE